MMEINNEILNNSVKGISKALIVSSFMFNVILADNMSDNIKNIADSVKKEEIMSIKSSPLNIRNISVNKDSNDVEVCFSGNTPRNINSKIYRGIDDDDGNITWIEDNKSFVKLRTIETNKGDFSMQFRWIAADPESPSKFFRVTLTDNKGRTVNKQFQVQHPNM